MAVRSERPLRPATHSSLDGSGCGASQASSSRTSAICRRQSPALPHPGGFRFLTGTRLLPDGRLLSWSIEPTLRIAHRLADVLETEKEFTRRSLLAAGCARLDEENREEVAPILDLGEASDTHELAEISGRSWDSVYLTAYRAAARLARELEL